MNICDSRVTFATEKSTYKSATVLHQNKSTILNQKLMKLIKSYQNICFETYLCMFLVVCDARFL